MEDKYILVSFKHTKFDRAHTVFTLWKPEFCGYTEDLDKAGRFTKAEIEDSYGQPSWLRYLADGETISYVNRNEIIDTVAVRDDKLEEAGLITRRTLSC